MSGATRALPRRHAPALALGLPLLVVLVGLAVRAGCLLNHDVAWLMMAAGRMLHGGSYSDDFFEVNMPLAIAIYIPPQLLVERLQWPALWAASAWTLLLCCQSVHLSLRVLAARGAALPAGPLAAWFLIGFIFLPGYDFGQKEHLIAILALPYLLLAAESGALPGLGRGLRAYIGTLAAAGFFLKPHYALLPVLLIVAAAARERSLRVLRTPEVLALGAVAALDALLTLSLYPDWFTVLHWAGDLYGAYRGSGWHKVLTAHEVLPAALCLAFLLALAALDPGFRRIGGALVFAAVFSAAVYLLQFTGWAYHSLAVRSFVFSGLGLAAAALLQAPLAAGLRRSLLALALVGIAVAATIAVRVTLEQPKAAALKRVPEAFSAAAPGDYVYAFSIEVAPIFPTVSLLGLRWASRYSCLWPLLRLMPGNSPAAEGERLRTVYAAPLAAAVAQDFARFRPRVVLVDRRLPHGVPATYDILSSFLANPRFAAIWRDYVRAGWVQYPAGDQGFDIYILGTAAAPG